MIIHGNCLDEMRKMSDNSIFCIVTDPPYGLKFMGKDWDHGIPGVEFWKEAFRISKPGTWMLAFGGTRTHHRLTCSIEDAGWEIRDCIMWMYGSGFPKGKGCLKPAYEPIIMARKGGCKVSDNFLNIDECRIEGKPRTTHSDGNYKGKNPGIYELGLKEGFQNEGSIGRFPSNVILDEESAELLDQQTGILKSGKLDRSKITSENKIYGKIDELHGVYEPSSVGASRFFYCAKSSPSERNGSIHPTMKPLKLMEYLIKLVMPKEGILLDPFAGSGTTILASKRLGIEAIGIELNEEYCEIARNRLNGK